MASSANFIPYALPLWSLRHDSHLSLMKPTKIFPCPKYFVQQGNQHCHHTSARFSASLLTYINMLLLGTTCLCHCFYCGNELLPTPNTPCSHSGSQASFKFIIFFLFCLPTGESKPWALDPISTPWLHAKVCLVWYFNEDRLQSYIRHLHIGSNSSIVFQESWYPFGLYAPMLA